MQSRVAVFGSGGVGGYFGARLAEAGHSVAFIARGRHLDAMRSEGLRIESVAGDLTLPKVEASDEPAQIGPVDLVIVAVKTWQVEDAGRAMLPLLAPATVVIPLENGVEAAERLGEILGPSRVLPGLCRIVSRVAAPGRIHHSGVPPEIQVGERDGRPGPRTDVVARTFEHAKGVRLAVVPDIIASLWEKFLFIAPFSAVAACQGLTAGPLRSDPGHRALLMNSTEETLAVGRACGARLRDDSVARTMAFTDALPAETTASMQRDLQEGRPSELEDLIGAVVRLGEMRGVATPVSRRLYGQLLPLERQARDVGPA